MKKHIGMAMLLVVLVAGQVLAATVNWDAGGSDSLWSTAQNWDGDSLPAAGDGVNIWLGSETAIVNAGAAVAGTLAIGNETGWSGLEIVGGTLDVGSNLTLAQGGGSSTSTMDVNGGAVTVGGNLLVGNWGSAVLSMNSGTLDIAGWLVLKEIAGSGTGHVQADGGTIDSNVFTLKAGGSMDITGGTVVFTTFDQDWGLTNSLVALISGGYITAYGGAGTVNIDVATNPGRTTLTAIPPLQDPAVISWSAVSGDTMELVTCLPGAARSYYLVARNDLDSGVWSRVAHSDDGEDPFVVVNLDYSTMDATGTNHVVYLESNADHKFFGIVRESKIFMVNKTIAQVGRAYDPQMGLAFDGPMVHRHGATLGDLVSSIASWKPNSGSVGRMFFADSDGAKEYWNGLWDGIDHSDDVELDQSGNFVMFADRPYMVPSSGWTSYLTEMTEESLLAGASAILPEEPLGHAYAGYAPSFKQLWVQHYGFAWMPPQDSALGRFLGAQLKEKLYRDLEENLMTTTRTYDHALDPDPAFIIPVHCVFSSIPAQLVAPVGELVDLDVDGYIGQVWTGVINLTLDHYGSSEKSFFGSAYALYDYFAQLSVGTDKNLWLLVDPVEDNPNHAWAEYLEWYKHCVSAMLLMTTVNSYEAMPWPERIFLPDTPMGSGTPAPEDFRKTVLTITQALQEMPLGGQWRMMGSDEISPEVSVAIADSIMWQEYHANKLQGPYGQLMPLIERGVPVSACIMERSTDQTYMDSLKVIVVSYEDFKPVKEEMNTALAAWVQRGGVLVLLGNSNDDLDASTYFWWNQLGFASPMDHLIAQVGGTGPGEWSFGNGYVIRNETSPSAFADPGTATSVYLPLIDSAIEHTASGGNLSTPGYFMMQRGPFVIAHARQQAISAVGQFVDIYDPDLSVVNGISLAPGESGLYRDVTQTLTGGGPPLVLHATHRLMSQKSGATGIQFSVKGPLDTPAVVRLFLGGQSILGITATDSNGQPVLVSRLIEGNTARLEFPNDPDGVDVTIQM